MRMRLSRAIPIAALFLVAGTFGSASPAAAAQLPDGSWRDSCRNGRVGNGMLYADCRRENGNYRDTSASIGNCLRFANRDGRLVCEAEDHLGGWHGSFRETCSNERIGNKGHLKADCRRADGRYRKAELSPGKCPSRRAANVDGNLVCESSGFGGSGGSGGGFGGSGGSHQNWHGSFQDSCRDISTDSSGNLRASCQKANGRWERAYLSSGSCPSHRAGNNNGSLVCEH